MQLICRLVQKEKLMRYILEKEIPLKVVRIPRRNKEERQSIQNIEVKELQNSGAMIGTDEEGEEIDVNKIQKALRTVGISMDGFFEGT